jgi:hypothetical protein
LKSGADPSTLPQETQAYVPKVLGQYSKRAPAASSPLPASLQQPVGRVERQVTKPRVRNPQLTTAMVDRDPEFMNFSLPDRSVKPGIGSIASPLSASLQNLPTDAGRARSNVKPSDLAKFKQSEKEKLEKLLTLFRRNPEYFKSIDPKLINLVQSLNDLQNDNIMENIDPLADLIYQDLESRYDDLVRLYGHEVVGDAIETVIIKHEKNQDADVNIESLSKEVLRLLRSRIETEDKVKPKTTDTDNVNDKNALIQLQADVDKIKNTLGVKENKIYYNVIATPETDLKNKFGLRKDKKGWYLKENAHPNLKMDALRAFGVI